MCTAIHCTEEPTGMQFTIQEDTGWRDNSVEDALGPLNTTDIGNGNLLNDIEFHLP